MKMRISILTALMVLASNLFAQCPSGNIILSKQSDIDNFSVNYPTCSIVNGDLEITSSLISNLTGLSGITKVEGRLSISQTGLKDLQGIENITEIGEFNASYNQSLISLKGLNSQLKINGHFLLAQNSFLANLGDFPNLPVLHGDLTLSDLSVDNLNAFNSLTKIEGRLYIAHLDNLSNLEGLESLIEVGKIDIQSNAGLKSLKGLDNLEKINGSLELGYCFALTDISSLIKLKSLSGKIYLRYLYLITSLFGLDNIDYTSITSLDIWCLSNLSNTGVESICNYVKNGGTCNLSSNHTGFNSVTELQQQCLPTSSATKLESNINIFPNPTNGKIKIEGLDCEQCFFDLVNLSGVVLKSGELTSTCTIDISSFPKGIYYIILSARDKKVMKSIMNN
ncbi:MAG: T9SS type A sorting domain-containing protein [Nostocales cyanobacterium W4_Combined_metabat2_030]|nr:T9SS type A sorting domain-containing protein [Nostocales cyanobacterium W4_Combined_metabat2_030]